MRNAVPRLRIRGTLRNWGYQSCDVVGHRRRWRGRKSIGCRQRPPDAREADFGLSFAVRGCLSSSCGNRPTAEGACAISTQAFETVLPHK